MGEGLKVGDRVKVTHKAEHDSDGECRRSEFRKALDGCEVEIEAIESDGDMWGAHPAGGAYFRPDELTPVAPRPALPDVIRAAHVEPSEHVKAITRAAEGLERERAELQKAVDGWVARCDTIRAELATEREARQAADALTGQRDAEIVDLRARYKIANDCLKSERRLTSVALQEEADRLEASRAGEEAARLQLSRVAAAWDAYRAASVDEAKGCATAIDRALAGVPAPVAPEEVLQAFDERGGMVAQVHPNASGGVEWMAARPFDERVIGRAVDFPAGCAAALASLSTWCDVAPGPREP